MMLKHNFTYLEMVSVKKELEEKNMLFLNHKVTDKYKNIFRMILSNAFYILKPLMYLKKLNNKSLL